MEINGEALDRPAECFGQEGGPIRIEKMLQGSADPIVVQAIGIRSAQAEKLWKDTLRPFIVGVQRLAVAQDDVPQQYAKRLSIRHLGAHIHRGMNGG